MPESKKSTSNTVGRWADGLNASGMNELVLQADCGCTMHLIYPSGERVLEDLSLELELTPVRLEHCGAHAEGEKEQPPCRCLSADGKAPCPRPHEPEGRGYYCTNCCKALCAPCSTGEEGRCCQCAWKKARQALEAVSAQATKTHDPAAEPGQIQAGRKK